MTWNEEVGSPTAMLACLWYEWMDGSDGFPIHKDENAAKKSRSPTNPTGAYAICSLALAPFRSLKIATANHVLAR